MLLGPIPVRTLVERGSALCSGDCGAVYWIIDRLSSTGFVNYFLIFIHIRVSLLLFGGLVTFSFCN